MPSTININGLTLVHKTSDGVATATVPDVCLTPTFGSPIPLPYPNVAIAADLVLGTMTVKAQGGMAANQSAKFMKSTGDEPGIIGGVTSLTCALEASFVSFSPTVSLNGKPACRLTDKMLMNKGNTVCMAGVVQAPLPQTPMQSVKPPEVPELCVFRDLTIECDHYGGGGGGGSVSHPYKSRKFRLESKTNRWMGIVVGKRPEKLTFRYVDGCSITRQSPGCGRLRVMMPDGTEKKIGNTLDIALPKVAQMMEGGWKHFLKYIFFPRRAPPETYVIRGYTGIGHNPVLPTAEVATIAVYPAVGWQGEGKLTYEMAQVKIRVDDEDIKRAKLDPDKPVKFVGIGSISAQYGASDLKYDLEMGYKLDKPNTDGVPFRTVQRFLTPLCRLFDQLAESGVKVELEKLEFGMGGGIALEEDKEGNTVKTIGNFWFGAPVILGARVEADILNFILMLFGLANPLGKLLLKFKKMATRKYNVSGSTIKVELSILLTFDLKIGGRYAVKGPTGSWKLDGKKAHIQAGGGLKLIAQAGGSYNGRFISGKALASVGLKSADGEGSMGLWGRITPGKLDAKTPGIALTGSIHFTGAAIYYCIIVEIGSAADEAAPAAPATPKPEPTGYSQFFKHKKAYKNEGSLGTIVEAADLNLTNAVSACT